MLKLVDFAFYQLLQFIKIHFAQRNKNIVWYISYLDPVHSLAYFIRKFYEKYWWPLQSNMLFKVWEVYSDHIVEVIIQESKVVCRENQKKNKNGVWVLICRINVKCAPFCRNSHPEALYKKHVLKNFAKLHRKAPLPGVRFAACNFIKKEPPLRVFPWNFSAKFSEKPHVKHLRTAASFLLQKGCASLKLLFDH